MDSCFSAVPASLLFLLLSFLFPCFFAFCFSWFAVVLLLCLSTSTCSSSAVMRFHNISNKDSNTLPYSVLPLYSRVQNSNLNCASISNKQIPNLTNSHIWESAYDRSDSRVPITANPYLSKFEGFGGVISRFFFRFISIIYKVFRSLSYKSFFATLSYKSFFATLKEHPSIF